MVALVLAAVVSASGATPSGVVKEGNEAIQRALRSKDVSVAKLASTVEGYVDFAELAKRALGKEWNKLSRPQQTEFAATMKGLLRASYAQKAIGQGTADVKYGAETIKDGEAEVATTIAVKKDDFPVVYKLYRSNEKAPWRVYDVVTDQVSLMETYHDQFKRLLASKGFDGLLATLKTKRDELEKSPAPAAGSR